MIRASNFIKKQSHMRENVTFQNFVGVHWGVTFSIHKGDKHCVIEMDLDSVDQLIQKLSNAKAKGYDDYLRLKEMGIVQ